MPTPTANGTPWKCTEAPAGLLDAVLPAGSSQAALVDHARAWVRAARADDGAKAKFTATNAPRRAIGPADAARMSPALAQARSAVAASAHADACFDSVQTGLTQGWSAAVAAERAHLVRLRRTPEARAKLQAFLAR